METDQSIRAIQLVGDDSGWMAGASRTFLRRGDAPAPTDTPTSATPDLSPTPTGPTPTTPTLTPTTGTGTSIFTPAVYKNL
jgi:hypothetical protein